MIYGYIRVSTDEQTDGTSLHTQKLAIQESTTLTNGLKMVAYLARRFSLTAPASRAVTSRRVMKSSATHQTVLI